MAIVLGLDAITSKNTGSMASPVWVDIDNLKDETLNMETSLSDVTTRGGNGWRLQVATLSEGSVDAQMVYDTEDADGFDFFRAAFLDKTRVQMGFFDGNPATPGTQGLIGGFSVTNFTINRALEEAMMVDITFTVREDDAGAGPTWYTAS